jgi:hypothetical protein
VCAGQSSSHFFAAARNVTIKGLVELPRKLTPDAERNKKRQAFCENATEPLRSYGQVRTNGQSGPKQAIKCNSTVWGE